MERTDMRKRRVIIFDDDQTTLSMMQYFFDIRGGYEVLTRQEATLCSIAKDGSACTEKVPCADIMISELDLNGMTGMELFKAQAAKGCSVPMKDKAILSHRVTLLQTEEILRLGCAFFEKPFDFHRIAAWLDVREPHMDLSRSLGLKRKEDRLATEAEVMFMVAPFHNVLKGVAVNTSPSGLCMRTMVPLDRDKTVTIHPNFYPNPSRAAAVRWYTKLHGGYFLSGLQYL